MKIATWNVNSIRARLAGLRDWLQKRQPDVVCLQETKVTDEVFPYETLEDEGYNIVAWGQQTYNGVAILSKFRIEDVVKGLPNEDEDAERRVLGCIVQDFMVLNLYVPNGRAVGHPKYDEKLQWLGQLRELLDSRYSTDEKLVVCGDFNITFDDRDVYDPERMREKVHCSTPERDALAKVMEFGLVDGLRRFHEEGDIYTWFDYRTGGYGRNEGLRIDHMLLTEPAAEACTDILVDHEERGAKAPSDHNPVIATFEG